jgi:hypothetical protein
VVEEQAVRPVRERQRPVGETTAFGHPGSAVWDVLSIAALLSLALLVTAVSLAAGDRRQALVIAVLSPAILLGVATAAATLAHAARHRLAPSEVAWALVRVWAQPRGAWVMVLLGCLLALPCISFYSSILIVDSDSSRLLASILYVQREDLHYLVESQEVLLPHALLGPIAKVAGTAGIQAYTTLSVIGLAGVVAYLAWKLSRSPVAVVAAVLALTTFGAAVLERTHRLPMYPTMLALGFLGLYAAHRAIWAETRRRKWALAALSGLLLVLSAEAHQVGQLFLVCVALLVVSAPFRQSAPGLVRVFFFVLIFAIPRLAINYADGGFDYFLTNRVDYWITEGYLLQVQVDFWHLPRKTPLLEYLGMLPEGVLKVAGRAALVTLALGLAGFAFMSPRMRRFALASSVVLVAITVIERLPFYPRYYSILVVGAALSVGILAAGLPRRYRGGLRLAGACILLLVVANVFAYGRVLDRFDTLRTKALTDPYGAFVEGMGPGEGVIGTRAFYMNRKTTEPRVYGDMLLSEDEYVTFLTWPSDRKVLELLKKRDVQWVMVPDKSRRFVHKYNDTWLVPAYGERARYPERVARSPWFCVAHKRKDAALYRLLEQPIRPGGSAKCPT